MTTRRPPPVLPVLLELPEEARARRAAEQRARDEALHVAARVGDHAAIVALVTDGASLEAAQRVTLAREVRRSITPLMAAAGSAEGASLATVELLVALGADPDRELDGCSALSYAAGGLGGDAPGGGDVARLGFFLGRGRVDELSRRESALFAEAITTGDAARVGLLIEHGVLADVPPAQALELIGRPGWRTVGFFDEAPIVCAARGTSAAVVERLITAGADPRIVDGQKRHPLFVVRDAAVARALVAAGLELELRGRGDRTPLADAIDHGDVERVTALLAAGADPNAVRDGRTLLMDAVSAIDRVPAIMRLLVEHGADPHALSVHGWNVLDCALDVSGASSNQPDHLREVLGYLVELGVADLGMNRYMSALERQIIDEARVTARRRARRD